MYQLKYPDSIIILDDHPLVTAGLQSVIQDNDLPAQVITYNSLKSFYEGFDHQSAQLYIIDIQLQDGDGRVVVRKIKGKNPSAKVIIISSSEDPKVIRNSYSQGADAYIIKNATHAQLAQGLIAIWNGADYIQDQVRSALMHQSPTNYSGMPKELRLTGREKEVLQHILEEKTTKEMAGILFLSEKTIESHRANLMIKLDAKNIAGLVKTALDWKLLE